MSLTPYQIFAKDPGKVELTLFEPVGVNINTLAEKTFYFSTLEYGTLSGDTPANQRYDSIITRGLEMAARIDPPSGPTYGFLPARSYGSIVLGQSLGNLDLGTLPQMDGVPMREYAFGGRGATSRHGGYSPDLGRWLTYSEMRVSRMDCDGDPLIGQDSVEFPLRTKDDSFGFPINKRTYFGCKGAVWLDGTNDYVVVGASAAASAVFNFTTTTFTVEFLLYIEANPGTEATIISRGNSTVDGWSVRLSTTGAIKLQTYQSGAAQTTTSTAVSLYRWVRVSARCGRILIDGANATSSAGTHTAPTTASRFLYFGQNSAGTVFFPGMISDVRIWSTNRTDAEINSMKWRPLDSSEYAATGLLGYWPADDGTGTTLAQKVVATGSGCDGTLTSGAKFVPSCMGGTEMQGDFVPEVWGWVRGFTPVLVHEGTRIYQVHSGSIQAFDRIDVGAVSGTVAGTPRTSLLTFLNEATSPGQHQTCITPGGSYFRLGSSPVKPLTVELRGDNSGSTFRESVSTLVRYIVCNRGWYPLADPTDLDTTSFSDLETANSAPVGIAYTDDRSVADIVSKLLASVGAVGFFALETGLFTVERFVGVAGKTALDIHLTEKNVATGTLETFAPLSPIFKVSLGYKVNYAPMGSGDLATGAAGTAQEKFVRKDIRRADAYDAQVKELYPDARVISYDTVLDRWVDARAESDRQLGIYGQLGQMFRFLTDATGFDRMDVIYFSYSDLDEFGVEQFRYGTSDSSVFLVLEAARDAATGGTFVTLWRGEV